MKSTAARAGLGDSDGERAADLSTWNRQSFWAIVLQQNPNVPYLTRTFVDAWLDLVHTPAATTIADHEGARHLITERERRLKGGHGRLHNQRALELWSGALALRSWITAGPPLRHFSVILPLA